MTDTNASLEDDPDTWDWDKNFLLLLLLLIVRFSPGGNDDVVMNMNTCLLVRERDIPLVEIEIISHREVVSLSGPVTLGSHTVSPGLLLLR